MDQRAWPLVLLPGTLCDARLFGPLCKGLQGIETRVVLTQEAETLREAAEQVLAAAPEQFALLGFSLGGLVAIETALCAPERVRGLALISTNPLAVAAERQVARREAVEQARTIGMATFLREQMWPEYCGSVACAAMLPLLEEMAESLGCTVFARQTEMALGREDYRSRLGSVRCSALVVSGGEDKVCPPATQRELVRALRGCTSVCLREAGHFPLLERPDEVAAAVAAWFNTLQ